MAEISRKEQKNTNKKVGGKMAGFPMVGVGAALSISSIAPPLSTPRGRFRASIGHGRSVSVGLGRIQVIGGW